MQDLEINHGGSKTSPFVTMSVGASYPLPVPSMEVDELIKAADGALYKAKEKGRNCVQLDHALAIAAV